MNPRQTENETHTLAPDLNRGMTAGMDRMDVNAHPDDTGISHGTKQGLMRVNERDRGTSQARLETQREKSSWEFNGNSKGKRQTHPGAISPRNRRKNSPRFQTDRAQTESTQEQKTPPYFDSQKLMEMMMKEFFQRKEKDRKWEKKEKPDSA